MKTLFYPGQREGAFGWAVCNRYLSNALKEHFTLVDSPQGADVVFMPIADHDLNPMLNERGKITVGYTFFESELGPLAKENAGWYDLIFCGSTWCKERLAERGIHNVEVLIQGVDRSIFHDGPKAKSVTGPRIFTGGKFEHRKGQDLVIRAFRTLLQAEPFAHLVCAWHNPWPGLIFTLMTQITMPESVSNQAEMFERILELNGIPRQNFTVLPQLTHAQLAEAMRSTDFGVFPNRCEGGTNLVMMEYAACGRNVLANAKTGHADVQDLILLRIPAGEDENKWAVQDVGGIAAAMSMMADVASGKISFVDFEANPPIPTWEAAAEKVKTAIELIDATGV